MLTAWLIWLSEGMSIWVCYVSYAGMYNEVCELPSKCLLRNLHQSNICIHLSISSYFELVCNLIFIENICRNSPWLLKQVRCNCDERFILNSWWRYCCRSLDRRNHLISQLGHEGVNPTNRTVPYAVFLFVTENILCLTCVVLKTYGAIYSVVYVLESNAYLCAIISRWTDRWRPIIYYKIDVCRSFHRLSVV